MLGRWGCRGLILRLGFLRLDKVLVGEDTNQGGGRSLSGVEGRSLGSGSWFRLRSTYTATSRRRSLSVVEGWSLGFDSWFRLRSTNAVTGRRVVPERSRRAVHLPHLTSHISNLKSNPPYTTPRILSYIFLG